MRDHSDMIDYDCLQANQQKYYVGSEKIIGSKYYMLVLDGGIVWKEAYCEV
jgi:hypothetical protein